jgi:hypothetical protein
VPNGAFAITESPCHMCLAMCVEILQRDDYMAVTYFGLLRIYYCCIFER